MANLYLDTLGYRSPHSTGGGGTPRGADVRALRGGDGGMQHGTPRDGAGNTREDCLRRTVRFADGREVEATLGTASQAPWTITADVPGLGGFQAEARDLFDALCAVRDWLAGHDAVLLVAGAARDVYPSGMMREAGGRMAYRMMHGQAARRGDTVDIMAPAALSAISGVAEQKENFGAWIKSLQA